MLQKFTELTYFSGTFIGKCPRCGKVYEKRNSYNVHVRYYCGEAKQQYRCQVEGCFQKFNRKHLLVRHMTIVHPSHTFA